MNTIHGSVFVLIAVLLTPLAWSHGDDDPLLNKLMVEQLELRADDITVAKIDWWLGKDLHKFWLKTEYERADNKSHYGEIQALYSKAVTPNWDVQVGIRHDFRLDFASDANWAVLGIEGIAPYFVDMETALFIAEDGDTAWRMEAETDWLLTQRLALIPRIEINAFGRSNEQRLYGSGLATVDTGLRLAYYLRREFGLYAGYNYLKRYGNTAELGKNQGVAVSESGWVAGFNLWF